MLQILQTRPFMVAIIAGACAQTVKVVAFLIVEKRVNYKRFVETGGAPNMHSTAFTAMALAVGLRDGFHSLVFALAVCIMAIVLVDTLNVKNATTRHAEAILLLMDRVRKRKPPKNPGRRHSYTPLDVLTGMAMGAIVALILV